MPPALHQFRMARVLVDESLSEDISDFPEITVFIPARDEKLLLPEKLSNVLSMNYPPSKLKILLIDSGSVDGTGEIARDFLSTEAKNISWSILRLDSPGKSLAVNAAIEIIDTEFFIMTDVDSKFSEDSLIIAISRLINEPKIGALCGKKKTLTGSTFSSYRERFNQIRIGESIIDSTPIFEGSLCAFRTSAVSDGIDDKINADDTQLALLSRRNNFRSVMDPRLGFYEPKSNYFRELRRSIRRAQGIIRCHIANRDLARINDPFGAFFNHSLYFYVFFPWAMAASILLIAPALIEHLFFNPDLTSIPTSALILIPALMLLSPVRDFTSGLSVLIISQMLLFTGKDLSKWRPIRKNTFNLPKVK